MPDFTKTNLKLILGLIIVFALFLRIYKVNTIPPSLNWDETSIAYNAYSIMETGRDEWGEFMPLHFKSFGEYKLPVQIYASIPGILLFGLNELGVRILPVVYGTVTVLLTYLVGFQIFKKKETALLSSFLMALSVWHIQLTRASFESSFSLMWVMLGVYFLLRGFNSEKKWWVVSAIPFAIAVYTYNSARIFVPLFLVVTALVYRNEVLKKNLNKFITAAIVFAVLLVPLIPFILSGEGSARYELVSITTEEGLIPRIEERRNLSDLPEPLPRLIHNRPVYISYYFARNYLTHFTPDFLFLSGAEHKHHHVQGMGVLYWIQAPFLLLGFYLVYKNKLKFRHLVVIWLLITFIPVATTRDTLPHALRTALAIPVYQFFTAYGFVEAIEYLKKKDKTVLKLTLSGSAGLFIFQFTLYLNNYYNVYPYKYSREWQYGYKEVVNFIEPRLDEYDEIVITRHYGEPHIFTLFYLKYPPAEFQNDPNLERFETFDWVRVLRFGKFYFPDLGDAGTMYTDIVEANPDKKLLFVGKPGDFPSDVKRLNSVEFINGETAFEIVESSR